VQGELIGVLNLSHPKAKAFHDDHLRMLILIAGQSAGVIQRFLMYEEMARLAITDDLTGLCNRRHFLERVNAEIDRARRYDLTFSLAMLDIDHFKVVNDSHGHALGDRILADMGRLLRKSARSSDLAARYGGEEFVVMMPMTGGTQAQLAGERLREMVAAHTFPRRKKLTVSVGLAGYPEDATTLEELLRRADASLYEAKRTGRNCVVSTRGRLAA
jgi:diguanylate cyclase (GGDEF)-like protein